MNILKSEQKEEIQGEEWTLETYYQGVEASYDKVCKEVACPSPAKTGKVHDITGKWKLMLDINESDTIDRSCENIVYHFKEDGMLAVSGSAEKDVEYEVIAFPFCPTCLPLDPQPNLSMGNTKVFCQVLFTKMILYPQWKDITPLSPSEIPRHKIQTLFLRID
jgi:hypothetical protein